jgi:hypothetical protein
MVFGKFKTVYSMLAFEYRAFLFDNKAEVVLHELFATDRVGDNVVNEMGSLNSIINLPRMIWCMMNFLFR